MLSEELRLSDLCRALGEPMRGHDRGEPVSKRRPEGATRKTALWAFDSGLGRDQPLERHIEG